MGATFLRKYNTAITATTGESIKIPLIKRAVVDFAVGADFTPSAGDIKVSKDGGAAANIATLPSAVAMGNTAYWEFVFSGAELTCKTLVVTIADSATKAVEDQEFIIETFGNASAMYQADLSLPNLPANVTQLLGTAWLTPGTAGTPDVNAKLAGGVAWASGAITSSVIATDAITSTGLATSAAQEIRNAITGGAYALDTDANGRIRIVDGTAAGEIDTSSGAIAHAILCDTTTTNTDMLTAAGVWAAATRVLTAGTNIALAKGTGVTGFNDLSATGVENAVWNATLSSHLTSGTTGNALNAAGSAGDPWSTALPGAYGAGTAGNIVGTLLDAAISTRATAAGVWASGTRTLTGLGFTLGASDLASSILTAAKFAADAIDSNALATSGVQEIRNAITGGAYALDTDANGRVRIVDGTAAGEINTNAGAIALVDLVTDITTKTGFSLSSSQTFNLTGSITGNLSGSVGGVTGNVGGNLTGSIGSLATQAKADVNTELSNLLSVTTRSMPGQATPSATPTLVAAIMQLFQQSTNKHDQDASVQRIYDRNGTTVNQKRALSYDGTTLTMGAVVTGP